MLLRGKQVLIPISLLSLCAVTHASTWNEVLDERQRQKFELLSGAAPAPVSSPSVVKPEDVFAGQLKLNSRMPVTGSPVSARNLKPAGKAAQHRARPVAVATRQRQAQVSRAAGLAPMFDTVAQRYDIDPLLLHAIARVESRHTTTAVSHAGAQGLMQVIVPTAKRFGVDHAQALHNPQVNLDVSAQYLKRLQNQFGGRLDLILAAYNAGEGAVEKYGRKIPPYKETQGYVRKVMAEYNTLRAIRSRQLAGAPMAEVNP